MTVQYSNYETGLHPIETVSNFSIQMCSFEISRLFIVLTKGQPIPVAYGHFGPTEQ